MILAFLPVIALAIEPPIPPSSASYSLQNIPTEVKEKTSYPYVGVGFSSLVIVPYAMNISLGNKWAKPDQFVGLDGSLNLTSTFISQYVFGKIGVPFYVSPKEATNSYFIGPFIASGVNYQFEETSPEFAKGFSWLTIAGVSVGRNIEQDGKLSFWQLSANIRRFNMGPQIKSSPWPTLTFQYGIGF